MLEVAPIKVFLGLGASVAQTLTPMPVPGLPKIIDVKSHAFATIALSDSGDVYFWGRDAVNFSVKYDTATKLTILKDIIAISGTEDGMHFLALDKDKNCYAWGGNSLGQCGASSTTNPGIQTPMLVANDVIDIMAGESFSYIIKSDGTLWGTGSSFSYSIWLNLPDIQRDSFTQLDPTLVQGCDRFGITPYTINCDENNTSGSIIISNFGGLAPFTYSIGGPFQSTNIFSNLTAGTYAITVKDSNGCLYSSSATIYGNCPAVGIDEINKPSWKIYPNPANDRIYFDTNIELKVIQLIDVSGRIVKTIIPKSNVLDVKELKKGIYFLQLVSEKGLINQKFIKQ